MSKALSVDEVNDLIAGGDPAALATLQALPSACVQDGRHETPFNVAIRNDNQLVIDWLLTRTDALNFAPRLDEDLVDAVRHTVADALDPEHYEKTEKYLISSFDTNICWQRTPLLTACRWGKRKTLEKLLAADADTRRTDLLGLNALELCRGGEDPKLAGLVLRAETPKRKAVKVTESLLQSAVTDREEYRQLLEHGNLTPGAKRFAFQIACALLDHDRAEALLDAGLKLNNAFNNRCNPLLEAAFSTSLDVHDHPDAADYAIGQRTPKSIKVDNDDILNAQSLEDIGRLFAAAGAQVQPIQQGSGEGPAIQARIDFMRWLVAQGLDLEKARASGSPFYLQDLIHAGSAELLETLHGLGFSMTPEERGDSMDVRSALEQERFEIIFLLLQLGHSKGKLDRSHRKLWSRYEKWKQENPQRLSDLTLPLERASHRPAPEAMKVEWELAGESMLSARLISVEVSAQAQYRVELVHDNVYGPDDETRFQVRVALPAESNEVAEGGDGEAGWLPTRLVEERLMTDDGWIDRPQLSEKLYEETPWQATFVADLTLPPGLHRLKIRVVGSREEMNGILSDWEVQAV